MYLQDVAALRRHAGVDADHMLQQVPDQTLTLQLSIFATAHDEACVFFMEGHSSFGVCLQQPWQPLQNSIDLKLFMLNAAKRD